MGFKYSKRQQINKCWKKLHKTGGPMAMMELGMCAQSNVAPSQHALCHTDIFKIQRGKKRDICQNSLCSPNPQTAAIPPSQPSSAETLMRSQSRVCPDHHFLPQPVTGLSDLIEFTSTQSASRARSALRCWSLPETRSPACLQTFYITASARVKDDRASREKGGGLQLLLLSLCLSLIHSS